LPYSFKFHLSRSKVNCFCALWSFEVPVRHLEWQSRLVKISTQA
jgi:hypothetical protein